MSVVNYLKNSGWAAIAAATVLAAMPAAAAPEERRGSGNAGQSQATRSTPQRDSAPRQSQPRGNAERPAQVAQRGEQRPQANPSRGEQSRPATPQRGERPQAAPDRGERPQATPRRDGQQVAQNGDRPNRPSTRPGGQSAQQNGGRGEQRGEGVRQPRNVTYADRTRDRTYGGRGDRDRDRDNRWQDDRRDGDRDRWRGNRDRDGRWQGDGQHGRWDHRWRDNKRYDWNRWRHYNRNIFHIGAYYSPYSHYSYSRLGIGYTLDSLFFGSRYWINDPWQYRLPAVYGPYRWVRYYDDVLLVDIYTGEVVDVIYDFFW